MLSTSEEPGAPGPGFRDGTYALLYVCDGGNRNAEHLKVF